MNTYPQKTEREMANCLRKLRRLVTKSHRDDASISGWRERYELDIGDLITVEISQSSSRAPYFMKVEANRYLHIRRKTKCYRMLKSGEFNYHKIADYINDLLKEHDAIQAEYDKGASIAKKRIEAFERFLAEDPKLSALNLDIVTEGYEEDPDGDVKVEITSQETDEEDCYPVSSELVYNGEIFSGSIEVHNLTPEKLAAVLIVLRAEQFTVLDMLTLGEDSILGPIINKLTLSMSQVG